MPLTRREALDRLARAGVGLSLGGAVHGCTGSASSPRLTDIRRGVGVFVFPGRIAGAIGWVASGRSALIVDTQLTDTIGQFLKDFQRRSTAALDIVVNTHHHRDHTDGNSVLQPVVNEIVAHANVPAYLQHASAQRALHPTVIPTHTFRDHWRIDLDDETVSARHFGRAHTGGDIVVAFERAGVVHLGDLVYNRFHPHVDRAHGGSLVGWAQVLARIVGTYPPDTIFVCSHARAGHPVTIARADVDYQRKYLDALLDYVRRCLTDGRSRDQTAARTRLDGFPDHASLSDRHTLARLLATAWDELVGE